MRPPTFTCTGTFEGKGVLHLSRFLLSILQNEHHDKMPNNKILLGRLEFLEVNWLSHMFLSKTAVRRFLGMISQFRAHIKNYAQKSAALNSMVKKVWPASWSRNQVPEEAVGRGLGGKSVLTKRYVTYDWLENPTYIWDRTLSNNSLSSPHIKSYKYPASTIPAFIHLKNL